MMKISKSRFETKAFLEIIHLEKSKICKIRKMMSKEKNILKNVNKLKNNHFNVKYMKNNKSNLKNELK